MNGEKSMAGRLLLLVAIALTGLASCERSASPHREEAVERSVRVASDTNVAATSDPAPSSGDVPWLGEMTVSAPRQDTKLAERRSAPEAQTF